jgi:membrane protein required for colicin V production
MALDLAVLGLLLVAALAGAMSGALKQLLGMVGVVAGWAAARFVAPLALRHLLARPPSASARAAAAVLAFVAGAVVATLLARALLRSVQGRDGRPGPLDRAGGALLGGAKAGLVAWVFLSVLALLGGRITLGPLRVDGRGSDFAAVAARHDLLELTDPRAARALRQLVEAAQNPKARERLERDPETRKLLSDPRVKDFMERTEAQAGAAAGAARDDVADEAREQARKLLDQPDLKALFERLGVEP